MKKGTQTDDMGEGVFYPPEACAGLLSRLLILAIDFAVIVAAAFALTAIWYEILPPVDNPGFAVFCSWVALSYVYLVIIESSAGTLGFQVMGMKIVNLKGEKPSWLRMTFRLTLWMMGPFNPLIDIFWVASDRHKQTLRDKLAGTYVVKKNAVPCGTGCIRAVHYFLLGFSILFPEVRERPVPTPEPPK